jgi:hypothetical protein
LSYVFLLCFASHSRVRKKKFRQKESVSGNPGIHLPSAASKVSNSCPPLLLVSSTFETPSSSAAADPINAVSPVQNNINNKRHFVTKTVTGFLDFTTTVGNTVMVFTPEGGKRKDKIGQNKYLLLVGGTRV